LASKHQRPDSPNIKGTIADDIVYALWGFGLFIGRITPILALCVAAWVAPSNEALATAIVGGALGMAQSPTKEEGYLSRRSRNSKTETERGLPP